MTVQRPNVLLVGTGVVGRAILAAHVDAKVSVAIVDQDKDSLRDAVSELALDPDGWQTVRIDGIIDELPCVAIRHTSNGESDRESAGPLIVIESILEQLDAKRAFFERVEKNLADDTILCSNTSTLRIEQIGEGMRSPERLCGMHFFMPVQQRWAVEVVAADATLPSVIEAASAHVRRINKTPLVAKDSPGFIVNRLLSPYLNEAMLLLCRGVTAEQLERAALSYGMPMSPLELIDWIGTRTMFDAGRAFWQAFPTRLDPAPMLGKLIKAKRAGRASGGGLYDYQDGQRSEQIAPFTQELCQRYRRNEIELSDEDVMLLLSIPMWIESAYALREGVARSHDEIDIAMRGGLHYTSAGTWLGFFDAIGSDRLLSAMERHSETTKSLRAEPELVAALRCGSPSEAVESFAAR